MAPLVCETKLAFATKKDALGAATVAGWRYGSALRVYHCRHCSLWHIASNYGDAAD